MQLVCCRYEEKAQKRQEQHEQRSKLARAEGTAEAEVGAREIGRAHV